MRLDENIKPSVLLLKSKRLPMSPSDIVDGGTAHVYHLARGLRRLGWKVHAVVRSGDILGESDVGPYSSVIRLDTPRSDDPNILIRDFEDGRDFMSAIPESVFMRPWSAVHVHHWSSALGLVDRLGDSVPVMYTPHLLALEKARLLRTSLPNAIASAERRILTRANQIVCLSISEASQVVEHYGVSPSTVHVIPNGVDAAPPRPREFQSHGDPILLTCIGRIARQKGLDVLLDALALLPSAVTSRIRLNIYGPSYDEPDYETTIRRRAKRSEVEVNLMGSVAHEKVADVLRSTDIYIQPSRYESQGIAIQEAMVAGTAIIASRLDAICEYLTDGVDALLVAVDSPGELAQAIAVLVDSPAKRSALGRAALESPSLQNWDSAVRANISVLRSILNSSDERKESGSTWG